MFGKSASRAAPNTSNGQINKAQNNFVVVLVDGDGALFRDDLLRRPREGAVEASRRLVQAVKDNIPNGSMDKNNLTIVVRIFANARDLSRVMAQEGAIGSRDDFTLFMQQFNNSCGDFDFINVGPGKENADSKMRKMLDHYYRNVQCKKIFWVGCHDNGYLHDLRQYMTHPDSIDRITLVETTPAQPNFKRLPFSMTRFDSVFRDTSLTGEEAEYNATSDFSISPDYSPTSVKSSPTRSLEFPVLTNMSPSRLSPVKQTTLDNKPSPSMPLMPVFIHTPRNLSTSQPQTYNHSFETASPHNTLSQPSQIYFTDIPLEQPQPKPHAQIQQWPNLITSGNGGISIRYTPRSPSTPSYASVGGPNHQNMFMQTVTNTRRMLLDMDGFRLDDPNFKPNDKSASDSYFHKLQKVKFHSRGFCNYKYLQGECRKGVTCPMEHNVLLSEDELAVHRFDEHFERREGDAWEVWTEGNDFPDYIRKG
ncbi:hypothetical protein N7494_002521 [Penicillium frequentans]|uniref:DUF7923 domain-containing protein n=1 Tax=Penicillium frequentans TaxID=3151616 RepID=A0AAD6D3T5_9EURO|nr:hypothetical protein N7494_002521 [Penicillium glabrum]